MPKWERQYPHPQRQPAPGAHALCKQASGLNNPKTLTTQKPYCWVFVYGQGPSWGELLEPVYGHSHVRVMVRF